jgi:O-antigen ligase
MGIIGHGNQDALLTAVLLLLTLPFLLKKSSFTSKAILLLSGVTLVLYQSRTVWLGLVLSFLIYLGTFRKEARILGRLKKLKRRGIYYGLILILLLGTIVVPRLFLSRFFFSDEGGGALRIKMFKEGVELYSQSPWIGHGVQNVVLPLMKEFPEGYTLYFPVPVHLTPLELALESGLVGLVTFFVPFYLVLRKILLLAIKHQLSYELLSVFCSIVVIMIYFAIQPLDNLRRDFTLFGLVFGLSFIFLYRSEASHE